MKKYFTTQLFSYSEFKKTSHPLPYLIPDSCFVFITFYLPQLFFAGHVSLCLNFALFAALTPACMLF